MEAGALEDKLSSELGGLSYDELAELERMLVDRMMSWTSSKDLGIVQDCQAGEPSSENRT